MNLSVVIPAYNEADNIKATIEELLKVIGRISDIGDEVLTVGEEYAGPIQAEIIDGEIQLSQGEKSPDV